MSGKCFGNKNEHCCWIGGSPCSFLRDDGESKERRWICTLREKYGNWDDVHKDEGYLNIVKPQWKKIGISDCGDWPETGVKCSTCGIVGE